ncbi:MAG: cysteine peptidase family C39 domain-containing protein [Longimicrobiales bacterium]|nr:cysteine peptidase family C39 domain-containing protein [Longimicrobiales bacterium]
MRTLPPSPRAWAAQSGSEGERRRRARRVLLVGVVAVFAAAVAPSDPLEASRWGYRAIIRARGGTFVSFPGAVLQSGLSDCGPAALATLIRTLGGDPPPTDSIAGLAETRASGTTFGGLALAARSLGLESELRRLDPAAMADLSIPVIAWVDGGHFVTVVPDPSGSALVLDPQAGPYRIGMESLGRYWSGEALVPSPDGPATDSMNQRWEG